MKDKFIFVTGIIFSIIIIGVSGWLFVRSTKGTGVRVQGIVETTKAPEATVIPQLQADYKNSEIQVLNGSGIAGAAKKMANTLKTLGYVKVTTANYEKIVNQNLLFAPTDFGKEINFENYKYEKSEIIKIILK